MLVIIRRRGADGDDKLSKGILACEISACEDHVLVLLCVELCHAQPAYFLSAGYIT